MSLVLPWLEGRNPRRDLCFVLSAPEGAPFLSYRQVRMCLRLQSLLVNGSGTGSLSSSKFTVIVLLKMGDYSLISAHLLSDLRGVGVEQAVRQGLAVSRTLRMGPTSYLRKTTPER